MQPAAMCCLPESEDASASGTVLERSANWRSLALIPFPQFPRQHRPAMKPRYPDKLLRAAARELRVRPITRPLTAWTARLITQLAFHTASMAKLELRTLTRMPA